METEQVKHKTKFTAILFIKSAITVDVYADSQAEAIEAAMAKGIEQAEQMKTSEGRGGVSLVSIVHHDKDKECISVFAPKPGGEYSDC